MKKRLLDNKKAPDLNALQIEIKNFPFVNLYTALLDNAQPEHSNFSRLCGVRKKSIAI